MKTRDAVLEYQKTLDDTGTMTKDMTLTDPVSALYLEFHATNGSSYNRDNFISDVITKIEIVDGSEVLYSVNQSQLEALAFYKTGKTSVLFPSEWGGGMQRHGVYLLFGRKLWDREYAMDFTRFKNPQLKITSALGAIATVSTTVAFVSGSLVVTIVAKVMEDLPVKPSQYLMAKEITSFTSANTGEKRIDLPTDYVYRLLMLRAWVQGSDVREVVSQLKLTCDGDKFIPFNRYIQQLDAEALIRFGLVQLKHDINRAHGATVRLLVNTEPIIKPTMKVGIGDFPEISWEWSSNFYLSLLTHAGANDTSARDITLLETGHALHATVPIPFGVMEEPDTWFDPSVYKKLEAILTQTSTAGAVSLVAEQVRPL